MSKGEPYRPAPEVPQPSNAELDARKAASREKTKAVVAARVRGLSWRAVAEEVGLSKSQAFKLWKAEIEGNPVENLAEKREEMLYKLAARERRANRIIGIHERELTEKEAPLARRERCGRVIAAQQQELDRVHTLQAKLEGTFAPTKHQLMGADDGPVVVEVVSADEVLAKLTKIAADVHGEKKAEPAPEAEASAPEVPEPPASEPATVEHLDGIEELDDDEKHGHDDEEDTPNGTGRE